MRPNAHRLFPYDSERTDTVCSFRIMICHHSQIMKVKFGDSPHNLQNLRDTRRAEQGRADNGLCRKLLHMILPGAGDTNISRFTIRPKRWNVLTKDKQQNKSSVNSENAEENRTFITKRYFKKYPVRKW